MGLIEYKLGELIELIDHRNTDLQYGIEDVCGVSNNKEIIPTKANNEGRSLDNFFIVTQDEFIYNSRTTRMGDKIGLGYNDTKKTLITSWNNTAFRIKPKSSCLILPVYLFMFFNRTEFDRYTRFNSWGSSTEIFSWKDMCDIEIKLPSITVQQNVVDAYCGLSENLLAYTDGLQDLKTTCQAYIEKLTKEYPLEEIGGYIEPGIEKNSKEKYGLEAIKGISTGKVFIETKANLEDVSLKSYLLVRPQQFAFVPDTSRRNEKIALALNNTNETNLISSIYQVFKVKDLDRLIPEYLYLWISRTEFDRFTRYHSWGSAREVFSYADMCKVSIPIPPKPIQQSIVDIYHAQFERQEVADKLNNTLREICPVLIKQSLA
jgi:type I restriction enzyme S subunit